MSCQILHLENLAKHLNKLWYWDPDRLLSWRTGNGKRKGYWSSKLILKSKSGLNRLIAPNTESKFASLSKTSTYIYTEISPPKPVSPFCFTQGESYDPPDFNNHTVCQRPGILDYLTEVSSQTPYWHIQQHVQTKQCKRKAQLTLVGWAHP